MTLHLRLLPILLALLLAACTTSATPDDAPTQDKSTDEVVQVRLLAFNDFHGALEGPSGQIMVNGESIEAGGAEYFAAHIAEERAQVEHSVVVAAGDLIGATPLISALFHDEPTIKALSLLGLDISSVGNHEFDAGVDELLRIVHGGCHSEAGCREGYEYEGAGFQYLAANVRYRDSGETILPAYEIREFDGVRVAFIGMTLEDTPSVVVPSGIATVSFHNEVETVDGLIPELKEQHVDTVVVLIHEGGRATKDIQDINDCADVQGSIVAIAEGLDPMVSVIVTGHSHQPYICEFDGKLVTQAASSGRVVSVIDMYFDADGTLKERSARQRAVTRDIEPHPQMLELVNSYRVLAEEVANQPIGKITAEFDRGHRAAAGNSALGQLIADSQLAASEVAGAQIAFMNPGGIRASLRYENEGQEPGVVTFAHLHTVQPFGNTLITMTLTGAQIHQVLEQQWADEHRANVLAVSRGFSYTFDPSAPRGERVDPASITLNGEPIEMESTYRVTVNNFMAGGGDGFTVLTEGTERTTGIVDVDAFAAFLQAHSPLTPEVEQRVNQLEP